MEPAVDSALSLVLNVSKNWIFFSNFVTLKGHCFAEITNFRFPYFHVISPNTTTFAT